MSARLQRRIREIDMREHCLATTRPLKPLSAEHFPHCRLKPEISLGFVRLDVFSARSLRPLTKRESNLLAFAKVIETYAGYGRAVKKEILLRGSCDESKTFVRDPLDCALFHFLSNIFELMCQLHLRETLTQISGHCVSVISPRKSRRGDALVHG